MLSYKTHRAANCDIRSAARFWPIILQLNWGLLPAVSYQSSFHIKLLINSPNFLSIMLLSEKLLDRD